MMWILWEAFIKRASRIQFHPIAGGARIGMRRKRLEAVSPIVSGIRATVAIVQAVGVCGAGVIIVNDIHLRMAWQLASVSAVAIAFVHCAHAYVPVLAMVVMVHGKAQGHRYQRDDGSQYT